MIRTPDQRLRVFISSTLGELAEERAAVKTAIEQLRLIPVMFESGARPHAPQELYQAYLKQSQIFIGVYGKSYGWVGPGMNVSGLEEEFHLGAHKPRLIYVKHSAEPRDPRLTAMLDGLKSEGEVSYLRFRTPTELGEQVQRDLAIMLSERFAMDATEEKATMSIPRLPALRGPTIGREADLERLEDLLLREDTSLVTVTGPGGNGKSRVCLATAHRLNDRFRDGAVFIPLASVNDPELVPQAIARALGSFDNMKLSAGELLKDMLTGRQMLLVLDNFEQILPAAPFLARLLEDNPQVKVLVSSRGPLHLRDERVYPLPPLEEPRDVDGGSLDPIRANPSVKLFLRRFTDVSGAELVDEGELRAVAAICRRLDGIPLAIELAAANARLMRPAALLARMQSDLKLLDRGARDLPERQRTLRATINWSHDLLDERARALFSRLSVLADRFTLADAHDVCGGEDEIDTMEALEQLADQGLMRVFEPQTTGAREKLFSLLHVVREFAAERLKARGEGEAIGHRHALHFIALCSEAEDELLRTEGLAALDRMDRAFPDVRAAFWFLLEHGDTAAAWKLFGHLGAYLHRRGLVSEMLHWSEAAGVDVEHLPPGIPDEAMGGAFAAKGVILQIADRFDGSAAYLEKAVSLLPDGRRQLAARSALVVSQMNMGHPDAVRSMERFMEAAERVGSDLYRCISLLLLGEGTAMRTGDLERAGELLEQARPLTVRIGPGVATAMFHLQLGNLLYMREQWTEAIAEFEESARVFDLVRMTPVSGWAHVAHGSALLAIGEHARAREAFIASADRGRRSGEYSVVAGTMLGAAMLVLNRGDTERGTLLFAAGENRLLGSGYFLWSALQRVYVHAKTAIEERVPVDQRTKLLDRGVRMGREAEIELLLAVLNVADVYPGS